jgi:AcrR family transcriptional regulator
MSHLSPVGLIDPEEDWTPDEPRFSERREAVLDVVETVFLRDGLRSVRIGRLAAEARCSRRTLYELATSKEELFLVVLDRMMRRLARKGREAIDQEHDPVKRIIAMSTAAAEGIAALTPTFTQAVQDHPPAKRLFNHHIAAARTTLEGLINNAIEQQRFRPVNASTAAEAVLVLVLHFTGPEHAQSASVSPATALALVFDILIAGAESRSPGRKAVGNARPAG